MDRAERDELVMRFPAISSSTLVVLTLGCTPRFEAIIRVEVTTNLFDATWIELRTRSQDGARVTGVGSREWPSGSTHSFNLVPTNGDLTTNPDAVFEVVAANCGPDGIRIPEHCVLVSQRVRMRYLPGRLLDVRMRLEESCRAIACDEGETCRNGTCTPEIVGEGDVGDSGMHGIARTMFDAVVGDVRSDDVPNTDTSLSNDTTGSFDAEIRCRAGESRCGASCVDLRGDPSHCGSCDARCEPGLACSSGQCARTVEVAVLSEEACALLSDGTVRCWGGPYAGAFGVQPDIGHQLRPVRVPDVIGTGELALGGDGFNCVKSSATEVTCWGAGGARRRSLTSASAPIEQLQCGYRFCCVRLGSGAVGCWGTNNFGQLGDGTMTERSDARAIAGIVATHLSCGLTQCCAVLNDGNVRCWGANQQGQLGDGTLDSPRLSPVQMRGVAGRAVRVSTSESTTCVILQGGALHCVGADWNGQLGDGPGGSVSRSLVAVSGLRANVVDVRAGNFHMCARQSDGTAWCWGSNHDFQSLTGERGDVTTPTRVAVPNARMVRSLGTGYGTTCLVLDNGALRCGGSNIYGQLGNGSRDVRLAPVQVGTSGSEIVAGSAHSCSVSSGSVYCWGENQLGQLGTGDRADRGTPIRLDSSLGGHVEAGYNATCLVLPDSRPPYFRVCWGANQMGQLGVAPGQHPLISSTPAFIGESLLQIGLGDSHTCGFNSEHRAFCFGSNIAGQLGIGIVDETPRPSRAQVVGGPSDVVEVVSGYAFSCLRRNTGLVMCWGDNNHGQLGVGDQNRRLVPTEVALPTGALRIFAGPDQACAVLVTGSTYCWGRNDYGALGNGSSAMSTRPSMIRLPDGRRVRSMALSVFHGCAITTNGELYCWGRNATGALGVNRDSQFSLTPLRVGVSSDFEQVVAGIGHTCALQGNGVISCWGANRHGELGVGLPQHPAGGTYVRW